MGVRPDGKVDGCDVTNQVSVQERLLACCPLCIAKLHRSVTIVFIVQHISTFLHREGCYGGEA